MSVVLVTGFGQYADETDNPSGLVARLLHKQSQDGVQFRGAILPVAANRVRDALSRAIVEAQPDVVVVTGVAPGRTSPALERVAVNVMDFPIPDVDGEAPIDAMVAPDGPDAYLTNLPVKTILGRWRDHGLPGYLSNSAGTFLCNQTFYLARHLTRNHETRVGMMHVPVTPTRASTEHPPLPSTPLDLLEVSVKVAGVTAALHSGSDLPLGAGAIS